MSIAAATLFDDISSLSRVGRFQDALSKLESDRPLLRAHNEELFLTLLAELAFETGIEEAAAASAREALRLRPSAEYTARIERVLAMPHSMLVNSQRALNTSNLRARMRGKADI